ncbi:hypothetical protein, partial [Streptomyces edwardsiae]
PTANPDRPHAEGPASADRIIKVCIRYRSLPSRTRTNPARTNEDDVINDAREAALFDKYRPSMIAEKLHNRLIDIINQPDASQRSGPIAPQIRYLP